VASTTFDTFARRQRRPLVAFAWSLIGDLGVAEDLAQDALHAVKVHLHRGRQALAKALGVPAPEDLR